MSIPSASCPVCAGTTVHHGTGEVMQRHEATFVQCTSCGLVHVVEPAWLDEAYSMPIADEDSGLFQRCTAMSRRTKRVIAGEGLRHGRFLDWGGGYGVFTRMMRDAGFDYYHDDAYAQNLFARDVEDTPGTRYDLITAFEVLEHLTNPLKDLAATVARTDYFLCSTAIRPEPAPPLDAWAYYGVEHGQHVMFHTVESLRLLGEGLGFSLTTNGFNLHLFHRRPLKARTNLMFSPLGRSVRVAAHRMATFPRAKMGVG